MALLTWDTTTGDNTVNSGDGIWDFTTANWTTDGGVTNTMFTNGDSVIFAGGNSAKYTVDGAITVDVIDLTTNNNYNARFEGGKITLTGVNDFSGNNANYSVFYNDIVITDTGGLTIGSLTFNGDVTSAVQINVASGSYANFNGDAEADVHIGMNSYLSVYGNFSGSITADSGASLTIGSTGAIMNSLHNINVYMYGGVLIGSGNSAYTGDAEVQYFSQYDGVIVGDVLMGGGDDSFFAGDAIVMGNIDLGDGDDLFQGGGSSSGAVEADILFLGDGDDRALVSGKTVDFDLINAGAGNDTVRTVLSFNDMKIKGGTGNDKIATGFGNDSVNGGGNDDRIWMGLGDDIGYGNDGMDVVKGSHGDDSLFGGNNNDTVNGGRDNDYVAGGNGDDIVFGNKNDDTVKGGNGSDMLFGGSGVDEVFGGSGFDTIDGGAGQDTMTGGGDDDVFLFASANQTQLSNADLITDFTSGDLIDLSLIDSHSPSGINNSFFLVENAGDSFGSNGVVYTQQIDGQTHIFGDIDNDAVVDFQIILDGLHMLNTGDFIGVTTEPI